VRPIIDANELERWASVSSLKRVEGALARNSDVSVRGAGSYTAMHEAAENGHQQMLRSLFAKKAGCQCTEG
jgi:hypothetical protein